MVFVVADETVGVPEKIDARCDVVLIEHADVERSRAASVEQIDEIAEVTAWVISNAVLKPTAGTCMKD